MTASEYNARSAAWKIAQSVAHRLRETEDDTEAVIGDAVAKLQVIRQELSDDRRAKAFPGAISR